MVKSLLQLAGKHPVAELAKAADAPLRRTVHLVFPPRPGLGMMPGGFIVRLVPNRFHPLGEN